VGELTGPGTIAAMTIREHFESVLKRIMYGAIAATLAITIVFFCGIRTRAGGSLVWSAGAGAVVGRSPR